jgi:hypothetical protein
MRKPMLGIDPQDTRTASLRSCARIPVHFSNAKVSAKNREIEKAAGRNPLRLCPDKGMRDASSGVRLTPRCNQRRFRKGLHIQNRQSHHKNLRANIMTT